jgi:thiol-disulfide isomerase/thioredoxin
MVRTSSLLLTQEKLGWRVSFSDDAASKYLLHGGDLLTRIDSERADKMGPLAVTAAFNAAFVRPVPISARRGGEQIRINLWRDDGPAPAMKAGMRNSFVSVSNQAPDFTVPSLGNVPSRLFAQRGKWVLLSFWATWCAPCQEEAPILSRLAQKYPQKLAVLALAVSDSRDKLNAFAAKLHPAYTILDAGQLKGQPALSYGVGSPSGGGSVPVNILIRPNGTIAYVQGGYEAPSPLERQVTDLLDTKR